MKLTIKRLLILTFIVVSGGFFGVGEVLGIVDYENILGNQFLKEEAAKNAADIAISTCQEIATPCTGFDCTAGFEALITCMKLAEKANADIITTQAWQEFDAKVAADQARAARRLALANVFKGSLEMFTRTLARDMAVWVASGGRGQQPLFVTEGWGAYMKNIGDAALGDFIDGVGQTFGMDLCQPNFQFKLAVKIGLDQKQFKARCTFTQMMTNWQSAVTNANFAFEYQMSMRPGENDISYALIMADRRNSYVADALRNADKTLGIDEMWLPIKNIAGNILTPGSFIKEKFFDSQSIQTATKGKDIFTGTAADFIEEFLNTLVAQLLQNLQIGFFGSGRDKAEKASGKLPNLWDTLGRLGSLFNPFASPLVIGESGAKERFFNLTDSQIKVGGSYDILAKLAQCSDTAKTNPGPTDCVIDQVLLQAIRNRKYVQDLPEEIKNRLFAPQGANADNLETAIPYRSILILRKYRIIPVGWEIAAKVIQNMSADTAITLDEVLKAYENTNSPFYRLVEPYWLLKAPEVYCRRLGYGGHNTLKDSQDGAISRSEYCADEQQCLREDSKGNCQAYGYCQEERRFWRIGTECDARYNTCQTYTARTGSTGSWLTNTLDFRYCNAQNAGCRSYATVFNYGSKEWNGDAVNQIDVPNNSLNKLVRYSTTTVVSSPVAGSPDYKEGKINEGDYTNDSQKIRMLLPCSESSCKLLGTTTCTWIPGAGLGGGTCRITGTCTVPIGEISCSLDNCSYATTTIDNSGFQSSVVARAFDALDWTDERSYLNYNNRHYRAEVFGRNNATTSVLHLTAVRNTKQLITTNSIVELQPGNKYKLKFWLKGTISQGSVRIGVFSGANTDTFYTNYPEVKNLKTWEFSSGSSYWYPMEVYFDTEAETLNTTNTKIAIITNAGSITDLYLDDFTLERTSNPECLESGVKLFRIFATSSFTNIHLDRDAQVCSASSEGCTEFIRPNRPTDETALYLKKAPAHFNCYGTPNATSTYPTTWPTSTTLLTALSNRKLECSFFAQLCILAEVGCELYRPVNGDPDVPGVVTDNDRCPEACVGYQVYKQEKTNFTNGSYRQFIADSNALYCSVGNVGCDEFTNLDKLGQEAEEKEYFAYFRRCQINNDPNYTDASAFYTWEGSDTTGYQLRSYNLKKASSTNQAPCTSLVYDANGIGNCSSTDTVTGVCSQLEMLYNSDCRQFYDSTGASHYRLLSKTIIVSNNCHPYRRTQTEATAGEAGQNCNNNGGWWKTSNECVYMGDPDYSRACPASAKGCRAYTGNRGNNIRKVIESHFDGNNLNDLRWVDVQGWKDLLQISLEATFPGGYSLTNTNTAIISYLRHPAKLKAGRSYTLSFWAKVSTGSVTIDGTLNNNINFVSTSTGNAVIPNTDFRIVTTTGSTIVTSSPVITADWKYYELGPVFITQDYNDSHLNFNVSSSIKIYLDNVILKETTNNIYLVENSWFTPVSCDNLMTDPQGLTCPDNLSKRCSPGEHLGCSAYTDRSNTLTYLRSFTSLCRPDAVGCEKLIDTFNLSTSSAQSFNTTPPANPAGNSTFDQVNVPANREVYLVNNPRHQCAGEDKGCQALGLPLVDTHDRVYGYSTVFLKNNPDRYSTDLCRDGEVWCEEFAGNNSLNYFKDPRNKTCDYRDTGIEPGWYRNGTNQACVTTTNQTYGTGYAPPSEKVQPIGLVNNTITIIGTTPINNSYNNWVGSCPPTQSSCSEYVDFLQVIYPQIGQQTISSQWEYKFKPYTLYSSYTGIDHPSLIKKDNISFLYYVSSSDEVTYTTTTKIDLTMAGVYYSLRDSVDYSSCNGLVDFRDGCILVDDRSQMDYSTTSANYAGRFNYLTYRVNDTYRNNMALNANDTRNTTLNPQAVSPVFIANDTADSSKIVKAIPDRACNKWLYCTTYEKKDASDLSSNYSEYDTCLDVSSCSYTDKEGRCLTFADYNARAVQNYSTSSKYYSNQTGYAMVGFTGSNPDITGYYRIHQMTQEGEGAYVPNSGFEDTFADTSEPIGWNSYDGPPPANYTQVKQPTGWASYKFASISDSKNAPEGSSYLMVNTSYQVISEEISVTPNTTYTLSFWVNTMNLEHPSGAKVNIAIQDVDDLNNPVNLDHQRIDSGLDWHNVKKTFNSGNAKKIILGIRNADATLKNKTTNANTSGVFFGQTPSAVINKPECVDFNENTACALSGFSLIDDIQIKPVLKTNDDTDVARTCRVFPAKDSKSCAYWDNNNFYYGQYGYCLMTDPKNSKQCLQWYPVDNLKGEMAREISGYAGRAPLYYCIERATTTIDISHGAGGISINESALNKEWSGLASLETGRDVRFKAFDVDPEYQVFMRYPFVRFFTYTGGFVALAGKDARIRCPGGPLWAAMHPYGVITGLALAVCVDTEKDKNGVLPILPAVYLSSDPTEQKRFIDDWEMYKNQSGSLRSVYAGLNESVGVFLSSTNGFLCETINNLNGTLSTNSNNIDSGISTTADIVEDDDSPGFFANIWGKIKDAFISIFGSALKIGSDFVGCRDSFDSTKDGWGGWGMVHGPFGGSSVIAKLILGLSSLLGGNELPITRYGTIWSVTWTVADGGGGSGFKDLLPLALSGLFGDNNEVKSSGMMQMKIVTENDPSFGSAVRDPIPDLGGDVLGVAVRTDAAQQDKHFMTTIYGQISTSFVVNYCKKFVRVVTSAGDNRALVGRVNPGSGYILNETVAGFFGAPTSTDYFYFNPFNYDQFMADPDNYSSSDYAPFGSLVQPRNSNDPNSWDSRDGKPNRQPLYQEPPRTQGYSAPYQARMGELHTEDGIKKIFAQSYGVWEWKDFTKDAKSGIYNGYYRSQLSAGWGLPTNYCTNTDDTIKRAGTDRGTNQHKCLIMPKIFYIRSNNANAGNVMQLKFNVKVDPDQLPITQIKISWGDGTATTYSGVSLRNRTNIDNSFVFYHVYNYDKIRAKVGNGTESINELENWYVVKNGNDYQVTPKVEIIDNWGGTNKTNSYKAVDVVLLIDGSGSMKYCVDTIYECLDQEESRMSISATGLRANNGIQKLFTNIKNLRMRVAYYRGTLNSGIEPEAIELTSGWKNVYGSLGVSGSVYEALNRNPNAGTPTDKGFEWVNNVISSGNSTKKQILIHIADGPSDSDRAEATRNNFTQLRNKDSNLTVYSLLIGADQEGTRSIMDEFSSNPIKNNCNYNYFSAPYCHFTNTSASVSTAIERIISETVDEVGYSFNVRPN